MRTSPFSFAVVLGAAMLSGLSTSAPAHDWYDKDDPHDSAQIRALAAKPVQWSDQSALAKANPAGLRTIKLLGFNDFHGRLETGLRVSNRPAGGAAILASYLRAAQAQAKDGAFIVHAGDFVGASPPSSALLQDEPSISFLNFLANSECTYDRKFDLDCNVVGTLGNHEFDEGQDRDLAAAERREPRERTVPRQSVEGRARALCLGECGEFEQWQAVSAALRDQESERRADRIHRRGAEGNTDHRHAHRRRRLDLSGRGRPPSTSRCAISRDKTCTRSS